MKIRRQCGLDAVRQLLRRIALAEIDRIEYLRLEAAGFESQKERQQDGPEIRPHPKHAMMNTRIPSQQRDAKGFHRIAMHGEGRHVREQHGDAVALQRTGDAHAQTAAIRIVVGVDHFDARDQRMVVSILIERHARYDQERRQSQQMRDALDDVNVCVLGDEMKRRDENLATGRVLLQGFHALEHMLGNGIEVGQLFFRIDRAFKIDPLVDEALELRRVMTATHLRCRQV